MSTSLLQPLAEATTAVLSRVNQAMNRTIVLPMLVFYATSRCNSRCVSCDWWRSTGADDLDPEEVADVAADLPSLGTRLVAFSGGEPLLRSDVFELAETFRRRDVVLHLLTSGLALERHASRVAELFTRVTVSLDGATAERYAAIRGVAALPAIEAGVARLRATAPSVSISARCTLHALNYRDVAALIRKARSVGFDSVSFLAADVMSDAFGRTSTSAPGLLRLNARQSAEFRGLIERVIEEEAEAFTSGFVTTSPHKLRQLAAYYAALTGGACFPPVTCNAPWVSAVLEADGQVRPCFFHQPIGNVRQQRLADIVRTNLPAFRRGLHVATNDTCRRCVCSIKVGMRNQPWR